MTERPLETCDLHALLDRIQAGDDTARGELIRRLQSRLERLARKMLARFPNVRRWEDTADVLQQSLVRLLRSLQSVRPASMKAFFGLAAEETRRQLLDLARHYRLANQHHVTPAGSEDQQPFAPSSDDAAGLWCAFHEAVGELPAEEREVVSLASTTAGRTPRSRNSFR
jgi:DNA-directed RNA polymerase specialized sigma24 family protein